MLPVIRCQLGCGYAIATTNSNLDGEGVWQRALTWQLISSTPHTPHPNSYDCRCRLNKRFGRVKIPWDGLNNSASRNKLDETSTMDGPDGKLKK